MVHATGLLHRAIHVLVFDPQGRVFLQKRSGLKDLHSHTWDSSCSGHVDSGEDYDTAAVRELGEEIGLEGTAPRRFLRLQACAATGREFVWVYRLESAGPLRLNPDEIEDGAWLEPAEVSARIRSHPREFAPSFVHLWPMAAAAGCGEGEAEGPGEGG